jgi:DNA-binding MarR family transcriptional regulator
MISTDTKKNELPSMMSVDRIIHEPARFMILSYLCVVYKADFLFVMNYIGLTRGNLSSHMTKLEEAGYISVKKSFKGKKPNTMLSITKKGRKAYEKYTEDMKEIFNE